MRYLKGPKRYNNIYCEILCLHDWGGPDGKKEVGGDTPPPKESIF